MQGSPRRAGNSTEAIAGLRQRGPRDSHLVYQTQVWGQSPPEQSWEVLEQPAHPPAQGPRQNLATPRRKASSPSTQRPTRHADSEAGLTNFPGLGEMKRILLRSVPARRERLLALHAGWGHRSSQNRAPWNQGEGAPLHPQLQAASHSDLEKGVSPGLSPNPSALQ